MRVLVTGGTGFVGCHTVAALLEQGHEVRVLARDTRRGQAALGPLGLGAYELVEGDMTDPDSVGRAVHGCEAVVHAAALYSFGPRETRTILETNTRGTQVVLEAAIAAGCDPIVHVSSYAALLPQRDRLTPDTPPGAIPTPYARSKVESDRLARAWQESGAPVVISYPGFVVGPHDPYLGESNRLILSMLRGQAPVRLDGVIPVADVRYVAAAHAAMLQRGLGARRYLVTGLDTPAEDLRQALRLLTSRRLPAVRSPQSMTLASGRIADAVQRILPIRLPVGYEGPYILSSTPRSGTDTSRTRSELRVSPPPLEQTLRDTVAWMVTAGHLPKKSAGRLPVAG